MELLFPEATEMEILGVKSFTSWPSSEEMELLFPEATEMELLSSVSVHMKRRSAARDVQARRDQDGLHRGSRQ
jgi:hypothetical protein